MIEGKHDHNHHDRSFHICITKIGRLVRQHIKPTKYLHEQLQKHTKTDPPENILTQLEKQPTATNIINNIDNGPHSINTTHDYQTAHKGQDNTEANIEGSNEQKISINSKP